MQFQRLVSSSWFLGLLVIHIQNANAGALQVCSNKLATVRTKVLPEPERILDPGQRSSVRYIATTPVKKEKERFDSFMNHWQHARLIPFNDVHQSIIRQYSYHIAKESIQGHARDENLARVIQVPALQHSVVHVVGEIDRLESDILDLEVAGMIPRRESFRANRLSALYRSAVLKAEWEFLSSLSPEFVEAELDRIARLRLPARDFKFIAKLLRAPQLGARTYRYVHRPGLVWGGRSISWTLTDVPANADSDENRQALLALMQTWVGVDENVRSIHARAEGQRTLAQAAGQRASSEALDPMSAGYEHRRAALEAEWKLLKLWDDRKRESALTMIEEFTLHATFKKNLRAAISGARVSFEDYVRIPANRSRTTMNWTRDPEPYEK